MYDIDHRDRVVPLTDIPQGSAGAPMPMIAATEGDLLVCYYVNAGRDDRVCVLEAKAHGVMFGEPSDETLPSHPLYERGLSFYGAFEVLESSWLRKLDERNDMCFPLRDTPAPYPRVEPRHIIICFHDSTLEFLATSWKTKVEDGKVREIFGRSMQKFGHGPDREWIAE